MRLYLLLILAMKMLAFLVGVTATAQWSRRWCSGWGGLQKYFSHIVPCQEVQYRE